MIMSLTYTKRMTIPILVLRRNNDARGAYLRPYKERRNLHTTKVGVGSKPAGGRI
jgi:hypothetical protein